MAASSSISIGPSSWTIGGSSPFSLYPVSVNQTGGDFPPMIGAPEFILGSGQQIVTTGGSSITYMVREFNNP